MKQMLATAERLHAVEEALGDFIMRWAVDQFMNEVAGNDRIYRDINQVAEKFSIYDPGFSHCRPGMTD